MRLSRDDLHQITHRKRPRHQAAWFLEYLGVVIPCDGEGPILTQSILEALLAKKLGVLPNFAEASPQRRPEVILPTKKLRQAS
jgi:hypothetical protein